MKRAPMSKIKTQAIKWLLHPGSWSVRGGSCTLMNRRTGELRCERMAVPRYKSSHASRGTTRGMPQHVPVRCFHEIWLRGGHCAGSSALRSQGMQGLSVPGFSRRRRAAGRRETHCPALAELFCHAPASLCPHSTLSRTTVVLLSSLCVRSIVRDWASFRSSATKAPLPRPSPLPRA